MMGGGTPARKSFDSYRLLIGLDSPDVLVGAVSSTGDTIAVFDPSFSRAGVAVQEVTGSITEDEPKQSVTLRPLRKGNRLYIYVKTISGDLTPVLIGTLVVSILVVIYNFSLRRLEINGRRDIAEKIDQPMIWIYPSLYSVGALVAILLFLV